MTLPARSPRTHPLLTDYGQALAVLSDDLTNADSLGELADVFDNFADQIPELEDDFHTVADAFRDAADGDLEALSSQEYTDAGEQIGEFFANGCQS